MKEEEGQALGSTKLAKAMRKPHEIAGDQIANMQLETLLTRQDVEAWLRRGVEFSDMKFHFVNYFAQSLLKSEYGPSLRKSLEKFRLGGTAEALGNLYMLQKVSDFRKEMCRELLDRTFQISNNGDEAATISMKFCHDFHGVFFARIAISSSETNSAFDLIMNARILSGYFVPTHLGAYGPDGITDLQGVFAVQDPLLFNALSHRTAYDSIGLSGLHYGEESMTLLLSPFPVLAELAPRSEALRDANVRLKLDIVDDPRLTKLFGSLEGAVLS
ncbi:hypothetical protein [Roseovarius nubinhibens]|uniref:Uncharacterized protein n=1 Tax=Roseovarius nubinhibens (strain ATCC BAA-591 / DSM 15170 / ISM) TaxID=89187 RepID=A3SLA6_ROSNI|nr:hypothetical protein [Roseovarius nubinhibens]EAP78137.1 hypothetical protein ISM_07570 [Roseovarius nubinhibens ISM]